MARVTGIVFAKGNGAKIEGGVVGDYPIDEAIDIIQGGRLRCSDLGDIRAQVETSGVEFLLAGLGVGSIRELDRLIHVAQAAAAALDPLAKALELNPWQTAWSECLETRDIQAICNLATALAGHTQPRGT